jgi:DNA polymerase III epsilon subunit-like protein
MIHTEMLRLNALVNKLEDKETRSLHLSPSEVVRLVLDEEEMVARTQSNIYRSVMGHRVVQYKKMDVAKWVEIRKEARAKEEGSTEKATTGPNPFVTELTAAQELFMLSRFVANTEGLDKFGYVLVPPTEAEISNSIAAVKASDYWEACDRCGSRFQVFPNRREDGALTSGGKCRYHFGRPRRPQRQKTDKITGGKATVYSCCEKETGTPGCVIHDTHVYKTTDRKRLATVLQFECTPENAAAKPDMAVSFDCEMGYTTRGFEMIRLSACTWPTGENLIDVLVRPVGHILDLNTRFSGVTPEQFLDAVEFDPSQEKPSTTKVANIAGPDSNTDTRLHIVPNPAAARALLLSHIAPSTPLIGHAIDNDLNVVRLVHPTIVDTALLFPAPGGLPYRLALKRLSKEFLDRDIQTGGANGHDSMEDARATGDLVRCKIAKDWTVLKASGWTVTEKDGFKGPKGWDGKGMARTAGKYCIALPQWWEKKRKRTPEGREEEEASDTAEVASTKAKIRI